MSPGDRAQPTRRSLQAIEIKIQHEDVHAGLSKNTEIGLLDVPEFALMP